MIKKIGTFALLAIMASCGSTKPYIQTTKNEKAHKQSKSKTALPKKQGVANNDKTLTLESTSRTTVYSEQVSQYVNAYKGIAQDNMRRHGIPASITLAQGILESGAGYGDLCVTANNHFGIKCHKDWTGDTVFHDDDAAGECFRKYDRAEESFEDHSKFLTTRSRYANLFTLEKDDYAAWAKGLKAAGYATDPKYPDKLIGLIERFELAKYDAEVVSGKAKPEIDKSVAVKGELSGTADVIATKDFPKTANTSKVIVVEPETPKLETVINTPAPATTVQQAPATPSIQQAATAQDTHLVAKGDTLYSISKKYNTTVDEIVKLNNLNGNAISIGQTLKVK
ncbi:MAG: glucosaminidase domain-containing protein [Bacteroidia bacterium]